MRLAFSIMCWFLLASAAHAQTARGKTMVQVSIVSETATVSPGQEFWVAVRQKIDPGWHTYWINPGDAGEPLTLNWTLPEGFQAGEIQWPLPEAIPVSSLVNYGYSNNAAMLVKMRAPDTLQGNAVTISALAKWLVCEEVCIPEEGAVSLTLAVAQTAGAAMGSAEADDIQRHAAKLPVASPWPAVVRTSGDKVLLSLSANSGGKTARFFPLTWGQIDNAAPQIISSTPQALTINMQRGELKTANIDELRGLLVTGTGDDRKGYWIAAKNDGKAVDPLLSPTGATGGPALPGDGDSGDLGLVTAMLFAALGGLILNLMPCVFPVLSIKALSLANQRPGEGRAHGVAFFTGVMASFTTLAILLIIVRTSGGGVGWGFQFQSPEFVLVMAAIFLAFGLSLSGVFHVGAGIAGTGDAMTRREGFAGYFFTGVLATIAATPCTAPFMGAALGYALTKPPVEMTAVLLALGAGFAAPMTILSFIPKLRSAMPKPGVWMDTLKQAMAFPLYATAAWLIWILSVQRGSDGVLAAAIAVIGVGFACWLWGRAGMTFTRGAAAAAAALALFFAVDIIPPAGAPLDNVASAQGDGPRAEAFSPQRLAQLQAEGRPVFVNFTAAWCITCKANERLALSSTRVREAFEAANVAYLKADWTNYNAGITAALQSFGRAGVPLYVLYQPRTPDGRGEILPQILNESTLITRVSSFPRQQINGDLSHVRN
ncbi:MAG: protein-disulfide reductase DsbD family protein [Hyphomicrobiales bacterium]|nr:protein-disulfide reductase DsbD family protein [Hyphomicrobiales bacterium]